MLFRWYLREIRRLKVPEDRSEAIATYPFAWRFGAMSPSRLRLSLIYLLLAPLALLHRFRRRRSGWIKAPPSSCS